MRRRKVTGVFIQAAGILILIAVVLICVPLTVPRAFGYEIYSATASDGAEDSLIYVEACEAGDLVSGDMAVCYGTGGVTLSRVTENRTEERVVCVIDTDGNIDTVSYVQVLGRETFAIPLPGTIFAAVNTAAGTALLAVLLIFAAGLFIWGDHLRRHPENG